MDLGGQRERFGAERPRVEPCPHVSDFAALEPAPQLVVLGPHPRGEALTPYDHRAKLEVRTDELFEDVGVVVQACGHLLPVKHDPGLLVEAAGRPHSERLNHTLFEPGEEACRVLALRSEDGGRHLEADLLGDDALCRLVACGQKRVAVRDPERSRNHSWERTG